MMTTKIKQCHNALTQRNITDGQTEQTVFQVLNCCHSKMLHMVPPYAMLVK